MGPVTIFDSTLRDGAQGAGVTFSLEDELRRLRLLDQVGLSVCRGWQPGLQSKGTGVFPSGQAFPLKTHALSPLAAPAENTAPEEDQSLAAVLAAQTPVCCVFGKCWKFHVDRVLETSYEENFRMIPEESCRF